VLLEGGLVFDLLFRDRRGGVGGFVGRVSHRLPMFGNRKGSA
jgi:hypothetical protein